MTSSILRNRSDEHYPHPREYGKDLQGRELLICWKDATWYEAVVVKYLPASHQYIIVYRTDDTLETVSLEKCRWMLLPKKTRDNGLPILDGAIVDFKHPVDHNNYQALVYDHSSTGIKLKVAYLGEQSTDVIRGSGWKFVRLSPCRHLPESEHSPIEVADEEIQEYGDAYDVPNHRDSRHPPPTKRLHRSRG